MSGSSPGTPAQAMPRSEVRQRVLSAIRTALEREIIPALSAENAVTTVHLLLRLIDYVAEQDTIDSPSLVGRTGLPRGLREELSALSGTPIESESDLTAIGEALAIILPRTDREALDQPEARFVRKLAQHEERALNTLDEHGRAGGVSDTYSKGTISLSKDAGNPQAAVPLSEERLTSVVRAANLFGTAATVRDLREIPGGFNKVTASFAVEHDDIREELIIRRDAIPNPTGFSVVNEYPILEAVWAARTVPIADPLLLGADAKALGSPFMIVRRMPGSTDISRWQGSAAAGRTLATELASSLARLHAVDVLTFLPPGTQLRPLGEYTTEEIDRWYQRSKRWRIRPSPAIDAGFTWMLANIPQSTRRPVLVHGDVGFHNMLMQDGKLTALLDWEFSHIGDPMEDLNYCRPFVTAVCDWQIFLDAYHGAGGVRFDESCTAFFELWPSLRNGSGCDALMRTFLECPGSDIKFAVAGIQHVRRYENAVLEFLGRQPTRRPA